MGGGDAGCTESRSVASNLRGFTPLGRRACGTWDFYSGIELKDSSFRRHQCCSPACGNCIRGTFWLPARSLVGAQAVGGRRYCEGCAVLHCPPFARGFKPAKASFLFAAIIMTVAGPAQAGFLDFLFGSSESRSNPPRG
jgi:hypothetical protein